MIRYLRGVVSRVEGTDRCTVRVEDRELEVESPRSPRPIAPGDDVLVAANELEVGLQTLEVQILLGPWPSDVPDPAGPLGLANTPVVVLPDNRTSEPELARAGALRTGGDPVVLHVRAGMPAFALALLVGITEGADLAIVAGGDGPTLQLVRELAGRPLPALPLSSPRSIDAFLAGCEIDLDVPVPSLDGDARAALLKLLRPFALEDRHHVVEVDPRPAFDQLHRPVPDDLTLLAVAAAGVLAGRLATRNRRWRADTQT